MPENQLEKCACKRTNCERHGKCAECIAHHQNSRYPPQCKRGESGKRPKQKKEKSPGAKP